MTFADPLDQMREMRGIAMTLAIGFQAEQSLNDHANAVAAPPGFIPDHERCLPCCRFAAAIIRGADPAAAEDLRCETARLWIYAVREAHATAERLLSGQAD